MKRKKKKINNKAPAQPGIRVKGGTRFDEEKGGWIAMLHIWPNTEAIGEPVEYSDGKLFPTELVALGYYQQTLRPMVEKIQDQVGGMAGVGKIVRLLKEEV